MTDSSLAGRILVVDDERNIRRTLRMVLEGEGATVLEAATGEEALAAIEGMAQQRDAVEGEMRETPINTRSDLMLARVYVLETGDMEGTTRLAELVARRVKAAAAEGWL